LPNQLPNRSSAIPFPYYRLDTNPLSIFLASASPPLPFHFCSSNLNTMEDKYIGLLLAVSGSVAIGTSFIITKKVCFRFGFLIRTLIPD
jgi:hypothetical protein